MFVRVSYPHIFQGVGREMDELLSGAFAHMHAKTFPSVDLAEHDNSFELIAELPGVKKEDLKISFESGVLTLAGERKGTFAEDAKVMHRETRAHRFNRSFELPSDVDGGGISADLKEGVLRIRLPKSEQDRPREIRIQ